MSAPNSAKNFRAKSRPHSFPRPLSAGGNTLAEAGRIHIPRKLFRPAESIFRVLRRDCFGKKFGFCSRDTARFEKMNLRQNSERRKATRLEFPRESAKGF